MSHPTRRRFLPAELSAEQRQVYDHITTARRPSESAFPVLNADGSLTGPFDAMLLSPAIGDALQALGSALRFRGELSDRAREMVILVVAHHERSRFEIDAHEAVGRRVGLTDSELAALSEHRVPESASSYEEAVLFVATALLMKRGLHETVPAVDVDTLHDAEIFEICTLVGYYRMLATQLRLFPA